MGLRVDGYSEASGWLAKADPPAMRSGPSFYQRTGAIKNQSFDRVVIPRFTNTRIPLSETRNSFNEIMDRLCAHEFRNELIANDTVEAVKRGRMPLVITKRIDHARYLAKLIDNRGCKVVLLTGRGTAKEKARRLDEIKQIEGRFAIVATRSYIGEGFDFPALDTLVMASPYKWEGLITQYSGRLHREVEERQMSSSMTMWI